MSAYALFFRDTQAAIKGQNPNASFGEVSKIVASMWDVLATEHKNVSTFKIFVLFYVQEKINLIEDKYSLTSPEWQGLGK